MSNRTKNDSWVDKYFQPYDADAHARELAEHDSFNILVPEAIPGGFRNQLEKFAASDSPEVQAALREAGIDSPQTPKPFHLSDGTVGEVFADANGTWHPVVIQISGQELDFAGDDRDLVMMSAERYLEKNRGPRDLTPEEELRVKRLALAGESANAAQLYCELRLSNMKHRSEQEILTDPSLVGVLNDGARFVWSCTRPDYIPSEEFDQLLDRISATRVLNINIVDVLYDRFTDHQAAAARAPRQAAPQAAAAPESERQPAPTAEEIRASLETMSTAELGKLRLQSLRHRGHAIRKFDERLRGQ